MKAFRDSQAFVHRRLLSWVVRQYFSNDRG